LKLTCLGRGSSDFYEIWHTGVLITTCPGIDIALEEGFDQAGKAGFGVLHASQSDMQHVYFIFVTMSVVFLSFRQKID